jgi:VanZ family protein
MQTDGAQVPDSANNEYWLKYLLPVILWMVGIFVSSSLSPESFPKVTSWVWAKLVHLIYYMVLCFLAARALRQQPRFPNLARYPYAYGILFAVIYGATDEVHQLFTPGRHGQFSDIFIDGLGAFLCLAFVRLFQSLKQNRNPSPL